MNIAGVDIGPDQPCRIVAEISNNHNGELSTCLRLIRECAEAGADFVKFQCYTPDELVILRGGGPAPEPWGSEGWTMRDLYKKAQTPHNWFPDIVAYCESLGIPWFSSVFGDESMRLLESLDCPAYKISALDNATEFAGDMACTSKPLLMSLRGHENLTTDSADFFLDCPEGYPQTEGYDRDFGPGFSYHGNSWREPRAAIANGCELIEVHVQLDDCPSELEAGVSLTVGQLKRLCAFAEMWTP
jgi:N-acetylneuraminate synthase|tara:strand:- start:6337 stop:7068 length:732 start_codon:yes stop_codon:yes gene_type:complete